MSSHSRAPEEQQRLPGGCNTNKNNNINTEENPTSRLLSSKPECFTRKKSYRGMKIFLTSQTADLLTLPVKTDKTHLFSPQQQIIDYYLIVSHINLNQQSFGPHQLSIISPSLLMTQFLNLSQTLVMSIWKDFSSTPAMNKVPKVKNANYKCFYNSRLSNSG